MHHDEALRANRIVLQQESQVTDVRDSLTFSLQLVQRVGEGGITICDLVSKNGPPSATQFHIFQRPNLSVQRGSFVDPKFQKEILRFTLSHASE